MSKLYERVANLRLSIEDVQVEARSLEVNPHFTRHTTTILLRGADGKVGGGEDVTYEAADQRLLQAATPLDLRGEYTLENFSARLDELDLWNGSGPMRDVSRDYRRWAYESAALDLALAQSRRSLPEVLAREARPLRFVVSMGLGNPPTTKPLRERLALYPNMRFKLDVNAGWDRDLCGELAELNCVAVVDLKGYYSGTPVDLDPDVKLYECVASELSDAWIEDARLSETILARLAPYRERLTFDAPIHRTSDLEALPFLPSCTNIKPSRSGKLRDLFELYEYCEAKGIAMYSGGQFELGIGREQCQLLASLFHSDADNDIAPAVFHSPDVTSGMPESPLEIVASSAGFRF